MVFSVANIWWIYIANHGYSWWIIGDSLWGSHFRHEAWGYPRHGWFTMEDPNKEWMIWGTAIVRNLHIYIYIYIHIYTYIYIYIHIYTYIYIYMSSVKNLHVRELYWDETKLGPRKWNPRLSARKRLRKQMLIVRSRKGCGSRFIHNELVVAEAPRKQNQLTTHPRKLKLWSRKQRGRARGRQVGLEENHIGVFATAHIYIYKYIYIYMYKCIYIYIHYLVAHLTY